MPSQHPFVFDRRSPDYGELELVPDCTEEECKNDDELGTIGPFDRFNDDDASGSAEDEGSGDSSDEEDTSRHDAISGLEQLVLSFLTQLVHLTVPQEDSKSRQQAQRKISLRLAELNSARARTLLFPRRVASGTNTRGVAQLFKVVEEAHVALVNETTVTKRDIYYRDTKLFGKQRSVDALVDDLVASLPSKSTRSDLNIRASAKGLFCGSSLTCHLYNGTVVTGHDIEASLIPFAEDIEQFEIHDNIAWILVVEKDAIFHILRTAGLSKHPDLDGPGLIITGKGYPDFATRQLVKTFSDNMPASTRILILVDADAYGLDIASVYKFGSSQMQHENYALAAERVEWIGISATEALSLGVDRDSLLDMTEHDRKKAMSMLRSGRQIPATWKRELSWMLHTRKKAEIEVLFSAERKDSDNDQCSNPLIRYLVEKINDAIH